MNAAPPEQEAHAETESKASPLAQDRSEPFALEEASREHVEATSEAILRETLRALIGHTAYLQSRFDDDKDSYGLQAMVDFFEPKKDAQW